MWGGLGAAQGGGEPGWAGLLLLPAAGWLSPDPPPPRPVPVPRPWLRLRFSSRVQTPVLRAESPDSGHYNIVTLSPRSRLRKDAPIINRKSMGVGTDQLQLQNTLGFHRYHCVKGQGVQLRLKEAE